MSLSSNKQRKSVVPLCCFATVSSLRQLWDLWIVCCLCQVVHQQPESRECASHICWCAAGCQRGYRRSGPHDCVQPNPTRIDLMNANSELGPGGGWMSSSCCNPHQLGIRLPTTTSLFLIFFFLFFILFNSLFLE